MEWLNWLIPLAAVYPVVYLLRVVLLARVLLGLRFGPARVTWIPREEAPANLRESARAAEAVVLAAGFEPDGALRVVPLTGEVFTTHALCFVHASEPINLSLAPNPRASGSGQLMVTTTTNWSGGGDLRTTNFEHNEVIPQAPDSDELELPWAEIAAVVQRHRERLAAALAAGRVPEAARSTAREQQAQAYLDKSWGRLRDSGQFAVERDGRLSFKLGAALKSAWVLLRREKKRKPAPLAPAGVPPVLAPVLTPEAQAEFDLSSYRQLVATQAGKMAWLPKTLLMIGSLAVFALALGWKLSVLSVVILLAVLIFHECGHLLGMRWFGHRDTQLLFLPFFGGAAVALDERVLKPWQHLVILFLGPLPGLFIGLGLWVAGPWGQPWVTELTWTLLILNLFNLLPIMPLDGGQILDTAVVTRFPAARAVFLALSGLALIGVTFFVHGGTVLGVLGVFMLIRLPTEWKTARLLKRLRPEIPPGTDEPVVVRRVLTALRGPEWAKVAPVSRLQLARSIQHTLRQPLPRWGTLAFAIAGVLSPLWLPLLALGPLYAVGAWRLERAAQAAYAAGLPPRPAPPAPDAEAAPAAAAVRALLDGRRDAAIAAHLRRETPFQPAEAGRAELVTAIRRAVAHPLAPGRADDLFGLRNQMAAVLADEIPRLAAAGRMEQAAGLVDDLLQLADQAAAAGELADALEGLMIRDEAVAAIAPLLAHGSTVDATARWPALLQETATRAVAVSAYDALARECLAPRPLREGNDSAWLSVFDVVRRWPGTRVEALESVLAARAAAAAGDFRMHRGAAPHEADGGPLAVFNAGGMYVQLFRAQVANLLVRQRLARAAVALHTGPVPVAGLRELPADVAAAAGPHPLTGVPLVLVRDERGVVLRFGPRPVPGDRFAVNVDDEDDELALATAGLEWWLTPEPVEPRPVGRAVVD